MPCVASSITPERICASPSSMPKALTAYPAVRAACSSARRVLLGPFSMGASTSTPMRRPVRVASAWAMLLRV